MEKIEVRNGRVHGVKTNRGDISCEVFVNCAGQVSFIQLFMFLSLGAHVPRELTVIF